MALMDWGGDVYRVDVDYLRVDVVEAAAAGPDLGDPVPYHPPLPDPAGFEVAVAAAESAVDLANPVALGEVVDPRRRRRAASADVNGTM
jgi:hypothetical protein